MVSVQDSWQRIEAWLRSHAPTLLEQLHPGASDEEIAEAEAAMGGLTLPDDFNASYRIHNGWNASGVVLAPGVFLGRLTLYSLASVPGVIGTWQMMRDLLEAGSFDRGLHWKHQPLHFTLRDPIRPVWWHLGWVPFAGTGDGEEWALDLAPALGGQVGQVIDWEHESGPLHVRSASLGALLAAFAEDLETGYYRSQGARLEIDTEQEARRPPLIVAPQPPLVLSPARQLLKQVFEAGRTQANEAGARALQERLARPRPVPQPKPIPPQFQPLPQQLQRLWMDEATAQQMLPPLLAVLDLAAAQMEDRLLAWEWLLLIHLALDHREHVQTLLPRCQREAEQAPAHYEIHRILRKVAVALGDG